MIRTLEEIIDIAKSRSRKRLAVVFANDAHTIEAVADAVNNGIVEATLTGITANITRICAEHSIDPAIFEIVEMDNAIEAGLLCCDLINAGKAQLIMKGSITTDDYMRCILNKERGLMEPGALLSHATVLEIPAYKKLLIVGDVAVIPAPTLEQKAKMLSFLIDTAQKLGNPKPLCALVAPSETPTTKISSSADAIQLVSRWENGDFPGSVVAGPMGFDLAVDPEAVAIKGYKNEVGGNADVILFPNIESGNVFYKTATKFCGGTLAGMVIGAKVPAVLTSRGDTPRSKLYSIALAAVTTDR